MNNILYKTMVEKTSNGIFLYKDDEIVFLNNAFARMLGYHKDELKGNSINSIIHPIYKQEVNDHLNRLNKYKNINAEDFTEPFEIKAVVKQNGSILPDFINSIISNKKNNTIWLKVYFSPVVIDGTDYILGNVSSIEKDEG